ncbi:MAG: HAMP domain-containing sensor histidine kinase [Bacteroidota bacterium]
MRVLDRIQEYFVPISLAMDPEGLRRGRIFVNAALFILGYSLLFSGLFFISSHIAGFAICLSTAVLTICLLFFYRKEGKVRQVGHSLVLVLALVSTWFSLALGGLNSPQMAWYFTLPITAFLIIGQGAGYLWTLVTMACLLGFFVFTPSQSLTLAIPSSGADALHFVSLAGLVLYFLMIVDVYEKGRSSAMEQLDKAQRKIMGKNKMLEKQKRAIKSQNNAIYEQNNVLEKQYQEIVNINSSLERIIHERTFKLKEALHDLDTFLYESSHALRRPVSSILGLLQVIRLESSADLRNDLTMRLEDTVKGMDNMLQKLIFINTINQEYDLNEEVSIPDTVNRILDKHKPMIEQRNIRLILDIQMDSLISSQHLMVVMLDNLLENAFNFSDTTGRRKAVVEVRAHEVEGKMKLLISDNGIGIPAQCKDRIFDLFYRASIMSTGNGLGLYMVKKVVERLEGTISMRSEERSFTAFEVTLPLNQHDPVKKKILPQAVIP